MEKPKIPVDLIIKHLADEAEHVHERAQKASDILLGSLETEIATTPYDVVYEEDRVKLKHYHTTSTKESEIKTPLLVVYALINRETMLDLQPERSVVKNFLENGINLYMIDWGYPTTKDKFLTIDDHVNGYMDDIINFIMKREGVEKINLMGICMGGTFSVIYSALHPEKVKNLITTVSPTNFDTTQGLLHVWMKWMNVDKMVDTFGNMPGDLMNFGFLLLNPARLMIDKYMGFLENMDDKPFVENFVRMEKWIFDSPDVPGETFRQFIKDFYQNNLLIQSKLMVGGKLVDLQKITMPLLNIYAQYDHLVPPGAAEKLTSVVGSTDTEDLCLDTGHIGIYVSSKTQKEFAPKIIQWLKDHEGRFEPEHQVSPSKKKSARVRANSAMKKKPLSIKRIEEMSHAGKRKLFFDDMQSEQGLRDNP
jgi:polyhydroxyalkanoate synthase subunit PhaC